MAIGQVAGGRFELEALAGAGAMGEVYRAKDSETGGRVAVKIMPGRNSEDAARFLREAQILSTLAHPHIVAYVKHGVMGAGDAWLAMEWLDGEDLAVRLAQGALSVVDTVTLGLAMADALGFVHERRIVHRDLKPSNVFLVNREVGDSRLLDFGIAGIEAAERVTRQGAIVGTPGYMSPEQVMSAPVIDARADVYSLGCMLFECLTGKPLFSGATIVAILAKVAFAPAPRLKEWLPDAPDALDELLWRMLSKDPGGRPEDGHAVAAALRALGDTIADATGSASLQRGHAPALTGSERRAVAVILVGTGRDAVHADDRAALDDTLDPVSEVKLRAEAAVHGGRVARLLNGAVAVELTGPALATDLACEAARCALALRAHVGGRPIALAIGSGQPTGEVRGPAIDRSARLLAQRRAPGVRGTTAPVLLDEAHAGLLDARFDVRQSLAGLVLFGERGLSQHTRTLMGKVTPCVGREEELAILRQIFEACVAESSARAVLVTADAGVGKSRLAQEFLRQVQAVGNGVATWMGRGDSLRAGSPFGLLGQLLRAACDVREAEPLAVRQKSVGMRVAQRVSEAQRRGVSEFLGEILGAPFPDEDSLPLRAARRDAQLMHEQMRAAFLSFVSAECSGAPLLIVLEDLHWGDQPTVQFLDAALATLRQRPFFVLALARPEVSQRFPSLWATRGAHQLRLRELGPRAIERLVRHTLGEAVSATTVGRLAALSDGNAFYLEELIRWAAERHDGELPETLVTMVQSRLGALDDDSRRALRVASIFGEVFWSGALGALLGGGDDTNSRRGHLRELCERELLVRRAESRFPGEEEYAFRHALLREGAYAMLTEDDRQLGHRLAGDWLEARGEPDALLLAEHLEQGGEGVRAASHYLLAAQRASAGSDTTRALACIERGLALPLPRDLRLRLRGMRCELHMYRIELAVPSLPEARSLLVEADRGSVPWTQALLLSLIAAAQTGARHEFSEAVDRARTAEFQPEALEVATILLGFSVAFCDHAGEVRRADALVRIAEALLRPNAEMEPAAALFFHLIVTTRAAFADEDPGLGLDHAQRALALANSIAHARYILGSKMLVLVNSCFLGAHEHARRAATEWDVPDHEFGLSSSVRPFVLSWTLADMGSFDEARAWAEHLIARGRARGLPLDEARGHWVLAEVLRRSGELEAAEAAVAAASALGEACPLDQPGVLATLAALRLTQGRPAEALASAEDGMARYEAMGSCGMFRGAFLRMVHVQALRAGGREAEAQVALTVARRCILANAAKITDLSLRARFLADVPENRWTLELAST